MSKKKADKRKLRWFRELPKRSYDDFANIKFEPLEMRTYLVSIGKNIVKHEPSWSPDRVQMLEELIANHE